MDHRQFDQSHGRKAIRSRRHLKLMGSFFLLLLPLFLNERAMAAYPFPYIPDTEAAWQALPPYCKARILHKEAEYAHWNSVLENSIFGSVHHYCAGLNYFNNYYKSVTPQDKHYSLTRAIDEISYSIRHAKGTERILPEFYVNRGKAFFLLGQMKEGTDDMEKAIELNPRTGAAYIALARSYGDMHEKDQALQFATEGLRYLPDSKSLKRIYDEMGGKQPYPKPYEKEEAPITQADENSTDNSTHSEAGLSTEPQAPAGNSPESPNDNQAVKEQTPIISPSDSSPIGSPTNPWCRFCPPDSITKKQ